ncbi:MAG: phospholipase D-like domain-containing protein [Actinomycetota bacterium]|jgi:cardiolipin synthase
MPARKVRNGLVGLAGAVAAAYVFEALQYKKTAAIGFDLQSRPALDDPKFRYVLESLSGAPVREGNKIDVLRNGHEIFPAMLEAIKSAERTINFATFVYWRGEIAPEFADALGERAGAGVEVNVLLDAMGAAKMEKPLVEKLRDAGAKVEWFRPPHWYSIHKSNNRTHRKILVVDGQVGFTGGVGIAEEWTGDCETPDNWRDTHLRIEGPVVRDLVGGFQENWSEATRCILTDGHLGDIEAFENGAAAQILRSSAGKGSTNAEELFYAAISCARRNLWLTTAYFAPRRAFVLALIDAVKRGVDVRILVNGPHIDKEVVRQAGRSSYDGLLEGGVKILEYQRTMLHAKTMVVDGYWATVGSINFDNRSFSLNDELNLSVWDEPLARKLQDHFKLDLEDAREVTLDEWRSRPAAQVVKERSSALLRREL